MRGWGAERPRRAACAGSARERTYRPHRDPIVGGGSTGCCTGDWPDVKYVGRETQTCSGANIPIARP
eukprot:12917981-Prorocentrum_lima.AAC.1